MEYTGLLWKYKLDRALTEQERKDHLRPKAELHVEAMRQFSVVEKTENYLEYVDKFYEFRGIVLIFCLMGSLVPLFMLIFIAIPSFWTVPGSNGFTINIFSIFMLILSGGALGFCLNYTVREMFAYTHWPVRFDRVNRRVYVFRHNGPDGVLDVGWDDIFFTLGYGNRVAGASIRDCYICGHVLDDDKRVQDTFAFGWVGTDRDIQTRVMPQWDYIRRFMEEGPAAVDEPLEYLPIAHKRETVAYSFYKSFQQYTYNWFTVILFSPLAFVGGIGRVIAMKTSRIPRWPDYVRKACGETS